MKDNQATFVGLTVEHVHNMIGELLRMAQVRCSIFNRYCKVNVLIFS